MSFKAWPTRVLVVTSMSLVCSIGTARLEFSWLKFVVPLVFLATPSTPLNGAILSCKYSINSSDTYAVDDSQFLWSPSVFEVYSECFFLARS